MIERLIELSYHKYKKLSQGCEEYDKLNRKIPITIDNITFTGWREYVCYKVCEYIKSKIPEANLELVLDGNNSNILLEMSEEENQKLNNKMYVLIKEWVE